MRRQTAYDRVMISDPAKEPVFFPEDHEGPAERAARMWRRRDESRYVYEEGLAPALERSTAMRRPSRSG